MVDNKRKVPKLRFPGFTDDWEQEKLNNIVTMHARIGWQNLRTSEFLNNGNYMLITGTDFKNGTIDYSKIHYVEKQRYDQDKKIQIHNESILVTKDGTLGKVAYVKELPKPATLNAGVFNIRIKDNKKFDSRYIFQYLKAPFLIKFANAQSTGGTIKHLNQNVLSKFPVPFPSFMEQNKISKFFMDLDGSIDLQQRKIEHLKERKKSLLQKMFPKKGKNVPEIRFPGFTDPWKLQKLGDIAFKIGDGLHGTPKYSDNGDALFINGNNLVNGSIIVTQTTKKVAASERSLNDKKLNDNTILMSINGTIGNLAWYKYENLMLGKSVAYIEVSDYNKKFIYAYLQTSNVRHFFMNNLTGTTIKNLGLKSIRATPLSVPKKAEQQKIGQFFKELDSLIELNQRKLEHLKLRKKGLLQQMFI